MFNQTELVAGTNGKIYKTVQCRFCQDWGHYQSHRPKVGQQYMNMENKEEDDEDEGANNEVTWASNLQIDQLQLNSESSYDSDGSYMVDFSYHQMGISLMNNGEDTKI